AAAEIVTVAADAASGGRGAPPRRRGLVPAARRLFAGGRGPAGPERGPDLTFRSPGPSISVSTETDEIDEAHAGRRALRAPLGRDGHPLGHQPHRGADPGPALPVAPAPQGRRDRRPAVGGPPQRKHQHPRAPARTAGTADHTA